MLKAGFLFTVMFFLVDFVWRTVKLTRMNKAADGRRMEWTSNYPLSSRVHIEHRNCIFNSVQCFLLLKIFNFCYFRILIIRFVKHWEGKMRFVRTIFQNEQKCWVLSTALESTSDELKSNLTTGTIHRKHTCTKSHGQAYKSREWTVEPNHV